MIDDLSRTLEAILRQPDLPAELRDAEVIFQPPDERFAPDVPTLNLFLYDIRENRELRSNEPRLVRLQGEAVVRPPALRVDCAYLLTAWAGGQPGSAATLLEQRLLATALLALARLPTVPAALLQGELRGQEPLPMMTAHGEGPANPAEFWTALGTPLRPAVTLTATVALEAARSVIVPLVRARALSVVPGAHGVLVSGLILNDADGSPVADAEVALVEAGGRVRIATTSDAAGRYDLEPVPQGDFILRVRSGGFAPEDAAITLPTELPPFAIRLRRA
jgi:hypothetical protein